MVWKLGPRVYQGGDYYLLLNIPPSASDEEIKQSFRRLALRFHTDKTNGGSEMFHRLEEAKRVLLDSQLRREYDRDRDTSSDPKLYCMFGSKSKTTGTGGIQGLKCGEQRSQELKNNLSKWRKMFKNLDARSIDDNVESSLLEFFTKFENIMIDELKEVKNEYYCRICNRNFSSEDEHYELMMAGYSDWILDEYNYNDNDGPNVFSFLQKKFNFETSPHEGQTSQQCNMGFCWTEDMFESQLQVLSTLLEEKDFERLDIIASGILMEIEKRSNFNDFIESQTSFFYLIQLIETRFKNDRYSAINGYRALFQSYPDLMTHPYGERVHQLILSELFKGEDVITFRKCLGGLHFLLWKHNLNSGESTNDSDIEFNNHMENFREKSTPLINLIVSECFNNIDFEGLSKLLQVILPCNIEAVGECLKIKTLMFTIDMDRNTDYEKLRGEYKPMFLMIRGAISRLLRKYDDAQRHWESALDCCSDVHFQYRDIIPKALARLMIDYEFHKSIVSRSIQDNESTKRIPDLEELTTLQKFNIWNQQASRSINYNVAKQNEKKIKIRFKTKGYLEKAFAFLDFSQGMDLFSGKIIAFIHVIQYLIAELSIQSKLQELFTLKKAVEEYSGIIFYIALTHLPPDTKVYVYRFVIAAQIKIGLILKEKINNMKKESVAKESSTEVEMISIMSEVSLLLLNQSSGYVLQQSKIFPFTTIPLLSVQDHVLSLPAYRSFVQHFIVQKSKITTSNTIGLFPPHIYAHEKLDSLWRGWGDEDILSTFELCRLESMQEFLTIKNWNFDDVEDLTNWPMLRRTDEGWLNNEEPNLLFPESVEVYKTFAGFELNMKTGEVNLYVIPSENDDDGLFTSYDTADVINGGITNAHFTLEDPDPQFRIHPFQEFSYHPSSLAGTDYLMTMLHADYFLKQIATGIEVNGLAPSFDSRPTSDGFLQRYSPELQAILRPVMERVRDPIDPSSEVAHRFWIEAGKVEVNITEGTGDWIKFDLKSPEMFIKTKKMKKLANGKLVDDLEATANTAEQQLADNMTKYYDEIGLKFPLLLRLKELTKISTMYMILRSKGHFFMELEKGLQNYESVSSTTNEYISQHETNIFDSIIQFRNKITSEIPSPVYSESRVETEFQKVLAANNLVGQEHRVQFEEITRVKNSIRHQLREADQHRIQNCVDQLYDAFELSKLPTMRDLFPNFLAKVGHYETETIVKECQKNWRSKEMNRVQTFLQGLQQLGVDMSKSEFDGLKNDPKVCSWVPATFCNEFKPPVEYALLEDDYKEEQDQYEVLHQNHRVNKETNKKIDEPLKLISSLVNLAIDDKPAEEVEEAEEATEHSFSNDAKRDMNGNFESEEEPEDIEILNEQEQKKNKRSNVKPSRVYGGISLNTIIEIASFIPLFRGIKVLKAAKVAKGAKRSRAGRTKRIKEIQENPKTPKSQKGWIEQEINQINRGKRKYIRNPPGTDMAHPRGREAAKGHDYGETFLQSRDLHRLQHKYDKMGTLNKPK